MTTWLAVVSTAYCLSGTMADGTGVRWGSVASNQYPLGTVLEVRPAPAGQRRWVVRDRIGWGTQLDFWMPSCGAALGWGRRTVRIRRWVPRPRPQYRARWRPRKTVKLPPAITCPECGASVRVLRNMAVDAQPQRDGRVVLAYAGGGWLWRGELRRPYRAQALREAGHELYRKHVCSRGVSHAAAQDEPQGQASPGAEPQAGRSWWTQVEPQGRPQRQHPGK